MKKDRNIGKVSINSNRENNSASNEPICAESKLDFDQHLGPKVIFGLLESASDLCYYPNIFEKECEICNQHTQLNETIVTFANILTKKNFSILEGDPRGEKLSCGKV